MNCYICQDICNEKNTKCKCNGYIAHIHNKCLYEMIEKTNNNICYFCDSEYEIPSNIKLKIKILNLYNNYLNNYKFRGLLFFIIFFFNIFYYADYHISKEIYYQVIAETDII